MEKVWKVARRLWKFKWYLLGAPLLTGALVVFLTSNLERRYLSKSTLQVSLPTHAELSLSGHEYKQHEATQFFLNLIEVIKSRKTAEYVRAALLLQSLRAENKALLIDFSQNVDLQADTAAIAQRLEILTDQIGILDLQNDQDIALVSLMENNRLSLTELQKNLKVYRSGSSNYVEIVVESENPFKSASLNELFIEATLNQIQKETRQKLMKNQLQLEKLVDQARKELDEKVKALERFKVSKNVINLSEHTKAIVNQIVKMEIKLAHLREMQNAHLQAAKISKEKLESGSSVNLEFKSNRQLLSLKDSLKIITETRLLAEDETTAESLLREEDRLRTQIIGQITQMVDEVPFDPTRARQDLVHRYIGYELDHEMESSMIPVVQKELNRLIAYSAKFAPLESSIGSFNSEIHTAQESYLILLNKLNLARTVAQGASEGEVEMFLPPTLPREPERSKRMFMVVGAVAGIALILGGMVVAYALLDLRAFSLNEFSALCEKEVFVALPPGNNRKAAISQIRKKIWDLPSEKRIVLFTGLGEKDAVSSLITEVATSLSGLKTEKGKARILIIGDEVPADSGVNLIEGGFPVPELLSEGIHLWKLTREQSPFECFSPERWKLLLNSHLSEGTLIIVHSKPAENQTDWLEWAALVNGSFVLRKGGQFFGSSEKRNLENLCRSLPFWTSLVFEEKQDV